jgi:hypothetical protein
LNGGIVGRTSGRLLLAAKGRQPKEPDDGQRGATGITISVVERPDGSARLVFDDVQRIGSTAPCRWETEFFYTRVEFDAADLIDASVDEEDLKNIGMAVVARLAAHHKRTRPT